MRGIHSGFSMTNLAICSLQHQHTLCTKTQILCDQRKMKLIWSIENRKFYHAFKYQETWFGLFLSCAARNSRSPQLTQFHGRAICINFRNIDRSELSFSRERKKNFNCPSTFRAAWACGFCDKRSRTMRQNKSRAISPSNFLQSKQLKFCSNNFLFQLDF